MNTLPLFSLIAVTAQTFSFSGGTTADLARDLSQLAAAPVAIARSEMDRQPARTIRYSSRADLRAQVGNLFGLRGP